MATSILGAFSLLSFFIFWAYPTSAYEYGAPCAAQYSMHPSSIYHGESRNLKQSPPPFRFFIAEFDDLDIHTYVPNRTYTIRLIAADGAHFRGFIIQPRLATKDGSLIGNLRAGHFILDQTQMDEYGVQFQDCAPFNNDSITHRNGTLKYFLEAKWTVDKNYGPIQFVLTLLQEQDEFWEMWRPPSGLLFPDDRNTEQQSTTAKSDDSEDTYQTKKPPPNPQAKKLSVLAQKLEYHKATKTNGQIGFVAHDQSETDEEEEAAATTVAVTAKRKHGKAPTTATTAEPTTVEAPEPETDEPAAASGDGGNQTEAAAPPPPPPPSPAVTLVRLPTPTPPVATAATATEDGSGGSGDEEEEEEGTVPPKVGSPDHKLSNANLSKTAQIRPQNEETEDEEETEDSTSESSTPSALPPVVSATKPPFRIPLSSLNRLRDLFREARQRNRNYTLTPEKLAELIPTPAPFNIDGIPAGFPAENQLPNAAAAATPIPKVRPTLPAANRLEFPTLPPFPLSKTTAQPKSEEEEEESSGSGTPLPQPGEEEGEEEEETRATVVYVPSKGTKSPQPVVRLLKTATIPPDAESEAGEGEDKEAEVKPPTTPKPPKPTRTGKKPTTTTDPFEDDTDSTAAPTTEAAETTETTTVSTTQEEETTLAPTTAPPRRTKSGRSKSKSTTTLPLPQPGEEGGELLPPAASANEEEAAEGTAVPTAATAVDPAPKARSKASNVTVPVRRTVLAEGTNDTVEEENDPAFLKEQDFCSPFPCFNKATCISLADEARFECKCGEGWRGKLCDLQDFCPPKNPCRNGGHCVSGSFGYTCNCTNFWVGKHCDNQCPATLCKNGGTCVLEEGGGYVCQCRPGYSGAQCEIDIDDCAINPCRNGGTCIDKVHGFKCHCADGYMGDKCHRPCQNIYKSCAAWGDEGKCESTRKTTHWHEINCGITCGACVFRNDTVKTLSPLPPVLEPLQFLIGRWTVNTTHLNRFPIDFLHGTFGYYEEIEFAPVNVPMFGTPSINFTAVSRNNQYPEDQMISHGFMTLKPNASSIRVALMSVGNDGITIIEEGILENEATLEMTVEYISTLPSLTHKTPSLAKRQFTLYGGFLRETVERQTGSAPTEYFTKYFYKGADFQIY